MPKITELIGQSIAVIEGEVQATDPADGQPLFDMNGPKMITQRGLVFVDPVTLEQTRVVFNEEERAMIVKGLTGGIEVAQVMPA